MKLLSKLSVFAFMFVAMVACEQRSAPERAADDIEDAADDAGDAIEDGVEDMGDEIEEATD